MNIDNKIYDNVNYIDKNDLHTKDKLLNGKKNENNKVTIFNNYEDDKRQDFICNYVVFSLHKNVTKDSSELQLNKFTDNIKTGIKIKKNLYQKGNNRNYNQSSNKTGYNKGNYLNIIKSVPLKNYINNSSSIDNNYENNPYYKKSGTNCNMNKYCPSNNKQDTYMNNRNCCTLKKKVPENKKVDNILDINTYGCSNININNKNHINNVRYMNNVNYINEINNIKYNDNFKNYNNIVTVNSTANCVNNNIKNNNLYYQKNNMYDIQARNVNNNFKRNLTKLSKNGSIINSNFSDTHQYYNGNSTLKTNALQMHNICNYGSNKLLDYSLFNTNKLHFHYPNKNYNIINSSNNLKKTSEKNQALTYNYLNNNFIRINSISNKKGILSDFNSINKKDSNEIKENISNNKNCFKAKKKKINNLCSSFIFTNKFFYEYNKVDKKKTFYSNEFSLRSDNKLIKKNKVANEFKNNSYFIELLLKGEKEAKDIVDKAYQNKKELRKLMHDKIEEEIENFKKMENFKYEESYKKMEEEMRSCEQSLENELQIITIQMQSHFLNIDEASNYIIKKIINVDLTLSYDLLKYYLPIKDILAIHLDIEQQNNQNIKKKDTLIIDELGNSSILHYNQHKNEHTIRKFGSFWTRIRHK